MILDPDLNARMGEALKKAYGRTPIAWLLSATDRDQITAGPFPRQSPESNEVENPLARVLGLPVDSSGSDKSFLVLKELLHGSVQRIEL